MSTYLIDAIWTRINSNDPNDFDDLVKLFDVPDYQKYGDLLLYAPFNENHIKKLTDNLIKCNKKNIINLLLFVNVSYGFNDNVKILVENKGNRYFDCNKSND